MKNKIFIVGLISLWGFVSCIGPFKKEEENKDIENLVLLEVASRETLEINGTWKLTQQFMQYTITLTSRIFAQKSLLTGTEGSFNLKLESDVPNLSNTEEQYNIVDFNNQTRTFYIKETNEPQGVDCNGNDTRGEVGVECYRRIQWTISYISALLDDGLFICLTANKSTLEEAKNDPTTANPDNLISGCPTSENRQWNFLGIKE